jgi:cytochrome c
MKLSLPSLIGAVLSTAAGFAPAATDNRAGAAIYERCLACHAMAVDRTGPRHCGLFGRRAGSMPGFEYSAAMKRSKIVWNAKTLDFFLSDPMRTVPGTSMGYAGVKDKKERRELIAYLKQASNGPECRAAH